MPAEHLHTEVEFKEIIFNLECGCAPNACYGCWTDAEPILAGLDSSRKIMCSFHGPAEIIDIVTI